MSAAAIAAVTLAAATPVYAANLPLLDSLTAGTQLQSTTDALQQTVQTATQDLTPVNQIVAPVKQTVDQATAPVTSVVNDTLNNTAPITDPVTAPVSQTVTQVINNAANPIVQTVVPPVVQSLAPVINNVTAPVSSIVTPVVTNVVAPVITGTVGAVAPVVSGVTGTNRPSGSINSSGTTTSRPAASTTTTAAPPTPGINQSTELIQTDENGVVTMSVPASFVIPGYVSTSNKTLPPLQKATYRDLSTGGGSLRSTITEASTYTFPVGMLMVLAGFVLLNGRIDRNERKLRDAPMRNTRRKDRVQFT